MYYKWHMDLDDDSAFVSGATFNTMDYALRSAMDSALKKNAVVIKIEIKPDKSIRN